MFETGFLTIKGDMVSIFSNTCFKPWLWKNNCTFSSDGQPTLTTLRPLTCNLVILNARSLCLQLLGVASVYILQVCPVLLVQFSKQKAYYKYCTVKLLRSIYRPEYNKWALLKGRSLVTCKRLISSSWNILYFLQYFTN